MTSVRVSLLSSRFKVLYDDAVTSDAREHSVADSGHSSHRLETIYINAGADTHTGREIMDFRITVAVDVPRQDTRGFSLD